MSDPRQTETPESAPWFFAASGLTTGDSVLLDREEARHAAGSKRLTEGDAVTLFDGRGDVARCTIRSIEKKGRDVTVEVGEVITMPAPAPFIELAFALPKGDRLNTLLAMVVPLGVNALRPLRCARSVATFGEKSDERWQRIMIEACKQSRRAHLPAIRPEVPFDEAILETAGAKRVPIVAHPTGGSFIDALSANSTSDLSLFIGPEGGFTEAEVESASANGAQLVSLGEGILRIETAVVAMLATARLARTGHGGSDT